MLRLARPLVLALLVSVGCADNRPNVLLITLDTTRADHLSCYGWDELSTPNLDRLAEEGTRFDNAFATNPTTMPSHASILTGTYPLYHGVRDNGIYVLSDEHTTLAEILGKAGYATAAVIGSFVLDAAFGLDQGFDMYDDDIEKSWSRDEMQLRSHNEFGFAERKANMVTHAAMTWLENRPDKPFFLWAHYFDPHEPINPPEPHSSQFSDPYVAEIAFMDEQVGELFAALKRHGVYDDTMIVVVGDHGEGRMDHAEPTHSLFIFDSTMRVPFIFKSVGARGRPVVDDLVSTIDIMPTVLELLGMPVPSVVQGMSLTGAIAKPSIPTDRYVYMETLVPRITCGWGELRGIRSLEEKLIHGPKPRYYKVGDDPGEIYDLAGRDPESVERLTAMLTEMMEGWTKPRSDDSIVALDPAAIAKLQALGYVIGTGVGTASSINDSLAAVHGMVDPHETRHLFDLFTTATEDIRLGRELMGISKLEKIVAKDPEFTEAIKALATAYLLHAQRPAEARVLFERTLEIDPTQDDALYFLAGILMLSGDLDGAQEHYEAALQFSPTPAPIHRELARLSMLRGDAEGARSHFERAIDANPNHIESLIALGSWHARRKEHEAAGEYFRRARNVEPNNPQVLYNIGIWYLQEENAGEAVRYLEQTIRIDPTNSDAYYVLGSLYVQQGRTDEARQVLSTALELNRKPERIRTIEKMLQERPPPSG